MSLKVFLTGMMIAAVTSILTAIVAASNAMRLEHAGATIGFALVAIGLTLAANLPFWKLDPSRIRPQAIAVCGRRNALAHAAVYAWGAGAMLTVYPIARLNWYHWGQYGAAMALIALCFVLVAKWQLSPTGAPRSPHTQLVLLRLTLLHGLAALAGVGWLVGSGKLSSIKGDWVANHIFFAGGIATVVIAAITAFTQRRMTRTS